MRVSAFCRVGVGSLFAFAGFSLSGFGQAPVEVVLPAFGKDQSIDSFTGTISARRQAELSPRISGLVQSADYEVGDHFEAGEVLVLLDPTISELEARLLEAQLEVARAEKEEAERLLNEAIELGDERFPRSARLTLQNNFDRATIGVDRAEAELKVAQERVERHQVVAPFAGVVGRKSTEVGEWVETGSPIAYFVGDELRLEVRVPQERLSEVLATESVQIQVQGFPDPFLTGEIDALGPIVDPVNRTFAVRVAIPEPPDYLKPGMAAVARFLSESGSSFLLVPRDAIIRDEDGESVLWILEENGDSMIVRARSVELGSPQGSMAPVFAGLLEGEKVVIRGNETLRDGQAVRIVGSDSARSGAED